MSFVGIFLSIISIIILLPILLTVVGYRVNESSIDIAKEAMEKNDVSICGDMMNYGLFFPPSGETRAHCVKTYASLTHDPSACELLMPSSYGLSCVGAAEEHLICDVESTAYSVYWRDGDIEHTESLRNCMQKKSNRSMLGNACCEVAKVAFLKKWNDCTPLKNYQEPYNHCLYSLAWKKRDPSICDEITRDNPRAACQVQTRALQRDPSICSGCTPPIDSIEDLKDK